MSQKLNPAKVSVACVAFLATLLATGGLIDVSFAVFLLILFLLLQLPSPFFFFCSFVSFFFFLTAKFINLKALSYLSDFSLPAYLLLIGGVIRYFLEGQKQSWTISLPITTKNLNINLLDLAKIGGSLLLIYLISSLASPTWALLIGYLVFSLILGKFEGRYAFAVALYFLVLCPFLQIIKNPKAAENAAIFTYYFLVTGTLQELITYFRLPPEEKTEETKPNPQYVVEEQSDLNLKKFLPLLLGLIAFLAAFLAFLFFLGRNSGPFISPLPN